MLAPMRNASSGNPFRFAVLLAALLASPRIAHAATASATQEHYLDIPGVGRVPIPLPPETQIFGPGGKRTLSDPAAPPAAVRGDGETGPLDSLFARLAAAGDEEEADALARAIARLWARSSSATADLLFARAALASRAGESRLALDLFDHIVALEPDWPQGLVGRADARLATGDAAGAERDLEAAVRLDPRRFDAHAMIGALHERAGAPARALDAYRRARALDPRRADWRKAEERLELEVEGRDI
jgi:tetratricopeptide (TPR) repeat protein